MSRFPGYENTGGFQKAKRYQGRNGCYRCNRLRVTYREIHTISYVLPLIKLHSYTQSITPSYLYVFAHINKGNDGCNRGVTAVTTALAA